MTETQLARPDATTETGADDRVRTYAWADPMRAAGQLGRMTGLEMLQAMVDGELPPPPIMATMAFDRIEATGAGQVTVFMTPREFHYNPLGTLHGGAISTLLDTATGCAVQTTLPVGMGYTSLDLNVRFLRPVTVASGLLRCEGTVTSRGRQTALGEAHLYDATGKLVAHATSTCLIFPVPAA